MQFVVELCLEKTQLVSFVSQKTFSSCILFANPQRVVSCSVISVYVPRRTARGVNLRGQRWEQLPHVREDMHDKTGILSFGRSQEAPIQRSKAKYTKIMFTSIDSIHSYYSVSIKEHNRGLELVEERRLSSQLLIQVYLPVICNEQISHIIFMYLYVC